MLAYILAVVVGTGSVGLYLAAFFLPAVHRKQDFIWSGVGLFYALFLWLYAHQVTGGILVGQTSSVVLLGWLTWQIFNLRRQVVEPLSQQIPIPSSVNKSSSKAAKSISQPTATTPAASTPLANTRVPAKAVTTPDRAAKTTSNANKFTTPVAPVDTEAAPRERKAAPTIVGGVSPLENRISPSASTPPAPTPQPSNLDPVKAASVERKVSPAPDRSSQPVNTPSAPPQPSNLDPAKAASVERKVSPAPDRSSQPVNIPATPPQPLLVAAEEERAWITLEVKPTSVPSPPLGTPAPPPAKIPPTPQSRVVPAVAPDRNIPTEPIQTTAKIDSEDGKLS